MTYVRVYSVYHQKKMFMTPQLDSHSTADHKPEILSAVKKGKRISRDGRNVRGIMHAHMFRKDDFLGKDDKTIVKEGEELHSEECILHHA